MVFSVELGSGEVLPACPVSLCHRVTVPPCPRVCGTLSWDGAGAPWRWGCCRVRSRARTLPSATQRGVCVPGRGSGCHMKGWSRCRCPLCSAHLLLSLGVSISDTGCPLCDTSALGLPGSVPLSVPRCPALLPGLRTPFSRWFFCCSAISLQRGPLEASALLTPVQLLHKSRQIGIFLFSPGPSVVTCL